MSSSVVQTPKEFFVDLLETIRRAKQRVYIQTMLFESGESIDLLVATLAEAARRGVEVKLIYDWISNRYAKNKLRFLPPFDPNVRQEKARVHARTFEAVAYLRQAGVETCMINHPVLLEYVFPVINRNHSKLYVVDDFCGWVGGVNLTDISLGNTDCVVKVFSPSVIKHLVAYFWAVWQRRLLKDYSVSCGNEYRLYFDSGRQGDSLIYRTGLEMVEQAQKSIVFLSQFVPNGPLLSRLLVKAKQGMPIKIITSSRENDMFTEFPYFLFYRYFRKQIKSHPSLSFYHHRQKIHAKLLIVDGEQILIGSHNLAFSGVLFGTQEISLWSKDKGVVEQLQQFAEGVE
jgi:cardiolipin synthase